MLWMTFGHLAVDDRPALITVLLVVIHNTTVFKIPRQTFNKLRLIIVISAISMNILGTLVLAFNPGRNSPMVLLPACVLLFVGIWIEKGIGLIVPGLVPSPLGEVVSYAPSWVEISIALGVLALGMFVVILLLRLALMIEHRYETSKKANMTLRFV